MQPLQSLTVIGGGSWATALVKIFSENRINVKWYLRSQEHVNFLLSNGRNHNYLSFLQLDLKYIHPTCIIEEVLAFSDDVLFAVPSAFLESITDELNDDILDNKRMYVSIKGIVSDQLLIPSVFLANRFNILRQQITVLARPCHAEEIAVERKTYLTIAGNNATVVNRMANTICSHYINVIQDNDLLGVEYAAILKNVIGIASGMVKGLNYGDNFLAVVVSNGMREIKDFIQAVDNCKRDLYNSAYFGDLLVKAYSEFSRNRNFGYMVGRGYSVPVAESRMSMIAEGLPAVKGYTKRRVCLA